MIFAIFGRFSKNKLHFMMKYEQKMKIEVKTADLAILAVKQNIMSVTTSTNTQKR